MMFARLFCLLALLWPALALGQTKSVAWSQVVVQPNTGAYAAGSCLGGVLTIPNMLQPQGPGGTIITSFTFLDPAHQTAANDAMTIWLLNAAPTGSYTDHSACSLAAADIPFVVGVLNVASSACFQDQAPNSTTCTVTTNLALAGAMPVTSPNLYAIPFVAATPTYGTSKLYFNFLATPFAF